MAKTEMSIKGGLLMTQSVKVGDQVIVLDSEEEYFFSDEPNEVEKLFRNALSLPVKKDMIFNRELE